MVKMRGRQEEAGWDAGTERDIGILPIGYWQTALASEIRYIYGHDYFQAPHTMQAVI